MGWSWVATVSVAGTSVAFIVGLLARRFAVAPGWGAQRLFARVAFTAAGAIGANVINTLDVGDATAEFWTRVQLAFLLLHASAWLRFAALDLKRPLRWDRWPLFAFTAAAAASLVPGVAFTGAVTRHRSAALGVHYIDVTPTALGVVVMAGVVGMGVVIVRRYVLAWRAGNRSAGIVAAALAALGLMGVNDALVTSGAWEGVYLIDVGFLIPIVAVARDLTARFAAEARERHVLHERLEALVDARTRALQEASQELVSSERMAGIARLASGVAHAINNPAAALRTNVHFLLDTMKVGEPVSAEAITTLADTRDLTERIADFVRRLVDASRVAGTEPRYEATAIVRPAALEAGARRAALLPAAAVSVDVPADLRVAMDPPVLTQVLGMLLQVCSRGGSRGVEIDAEKAGGDLRIRVKAPLSEAGGPDDALDRTLAVASGIAAVYGGSVATEADAARQRIVLTLRAR